MLIKKILFLSLIFCLLLCAGCNNDLTDADSDRHTVITDSIGRQVSLPQTVTKVAVANRYNMEIIKALGVLDRVVGVDYGIYQDQAAYGDFFSKEQVIGKSQNDLNYEKIIELQPQLLILTGNGAWQDAAKKLEPFGIRVIVIDAYYTSAFEHTYTLAGQIFQQEAKAAAFISYFQNKLQYIRTALKNVPKKTVYYEYRNRGTTTIPGDYFFEMLEYAHADNIFRDAKSTEINIEAVVQQNPDAIVKVGAAGADPKYIPPTAADFMQRRQELVERPGWTAIKAVQNDKILLLSQYAHGGASKLVCTMYIAKFLYPEYLPDLHPEQVFKDWVTKYQHLDYRPGHTAPPFAFTD